MKFIMQNVGLQKLADNISREIRQVTNSATTPVDSFYAPVADAHIILEALSTDQYCAKPSSPFKSSIGEHFRHILDHYHALMLGMNAGHVDYNQRTRQSNVETSLEIAVSNWQQINNWLDTLEDKDHERILKVVTEHNIVNSTLGRELSFISSHAVHHFAFIRLLASAYEVSLPKDVGVAPATIKSQQTG